MTCFATWTASLSYSWKYKRLLLELVRVVLSSPLYKHEHLEMLTKEALHNIDMKYGII